MSQQPPQKPPDGGLLAWVRQNKAITFVVAAATTAAIGWAVPRILDSAVTPEPTPAALMVRAFVPVQDSGGAISPYVVLPDDVEPEGNANTEALDAAAQGALYDWGIARGGVPGSPAYLRLELRGTTDDSLIVTGVRVRVVDRAAPAAGWFVADVGCGGLPIRKAVVDLDSQPVRVEFQDEDGSTGPLSLRVTDADVEVLQLELRTSSAAVTWTAEVEYSTPAGSEVIAVDGGREYTVTAPTEGVTRAYRAVYDTDGVAAFERQASWDSGPGC